MEQSTTPHLFELHIDQQSSAYLSETAKWAKFLSILGFIFCGLFVLFALFAGSLVSVMMSRYGMEGSSMSGAFFSFLYIVISVIYFFPCLFTFRFASRMQVALRNNDQEQLNSSFANLKSVYKYMGILMIIVLSFYALAIIFMIIGAAIGSR